MMEVLIESAIILSVLLGGSSLMRVAGLRGWILPVFGFITGIALLVLVGIVQIVITPLPTWPILTLLISVLIPVAIWLAAHFKGYDVGVKLAPILVVAGVVVLLVVMFAYANLVNWHTDSFFLLESASNFAGGGFEYTSPHNITKRLSSIPIIHSLAHFSDQLYLRSFTPLLGLSSLMMLVWFFRRGTQGSLTLKNTVLFAFLGLLLLATTNRFVFNSFYLNGHLLFAALLMLIAGSGWLLAYKRHSLPTKALKILQLLAIPVLVVTRVEASIVALVAILPTLLSKDIDGKHRMALLAVYGASVIAWYGFVSVTYVDANGSIPDYASGLLALGAASLLAIPALTWKRLLNHGQRLAMLAEGGLWGVLAVFYIREPDILYNSVTPTIQNVVFNEGSWGWSLIMIGILFGGLLLFRRFQWQIFLRYPVTTFIPLVLLFAYLRGSDGYRVGDGDSLNRMLIHIVPLAVLFITVAAAAGKPRMKACYQKIRGQLLPSPSRPSQK